MSFKTQPVRQVNQRNATASYLTKQKTDADLQSSSKVHDDEKKKELKKWILMIIKI